MLSVFANKQDLPGALSMEEIREVGACTLGSASKNLNIFYF